MIEVETPDGSIAEFPDGTSKDVIKAAMQKRYPAKAPPPGYGGASVDTSNPNPARELWNPVADTSRALNESLAGLKRHAGEAFPSAEERLRRRDEAGGFWANMLDSIKRMPGEAASAFAMPLDALGMAASPITGGARASVGSAMSYLPGMNKGKADNAVDLAMSAMRAGPRASPKVAAPTIEEIRKASDAAYARARSGGLEINPQSVEALSQQITNDLIASGKRERNYPGTFSAVEELKKPAGPTATADDLESVRRVLNDVAEKREESYTAGKARSALDKYMENIPAQDVIAGDPATVSSAFQEGRANWSAMRGSERVQQAIAKAKNRAESTYSGGNLGNAVRQELRKLLDNPNKTAGWTPEEIAQLERAVKGTTTGNLMRAGSKLLGGGGGLGAFATGAGGYAAFGPAALGLPAAGIGMRVGSEMSTLRQAKALDELIRSRSPLAKGLLAQALSKAPTQPNGLLGALVLGEDASSLGRYDNPMLDLYAR